MKHMLRNLTHWFETRESRELERHLSQAPSIAEVEHRGREWDSRRRHTLRLP